MGAKIRELRQSRKLSQEAFADAAGIDRSYVSGIENGRRDIGVRMLFTIAKTLKVKATDLLS